MAIDVKMVKELRDATGAGVLDAKKALESCGGDLEQAARLLREKGLARAAKRSGRETTEGRVEGAAQEGRTGVLVEVNCETDFVGRTQGFLELAQRVVNRLMESTTEEQPLEAVMDLPFADDPDATLAGLIHNEISVTGENMAVRRFVRYELDDRPGVVEVYVHPGNRVGVMLEVNSETPGAAELQAFGVLAHDLALHIAACAPTWLTREGIPGDKLEAERASYRQQALDAGKPEAIVERIVVGRLGKYYEGVVLSEQSFVKDDEIRVGELLAQRAAELGEEITVRRFVRYELGEALE